MDPGRGCKNETEGQPDSHTTAVFYGNTLADALDISAVHLQLQ